MSLKYLGEDRGYRQTYEGERKNFSFGFKSGGEEYQFIPASVLNKGFTIKDYSYYLPQVLRSDFDQTVSQYGSSLSLDNLSNVKDYDKFVEDLKKYGYDDKDGIFVSQKFFDDYILGSAKPAEGPWLHRFSSQEAYDSAGGGNVYYRGIQGLGEINGQRVYVLDATGPKNAQGWIQPSTQFETGYEIRNQWYDPGKSWAKPLSAIGGALIGLGTLGLAGIGPLAASTTGAAALGTGITPGALGITGLTPGAAGATGLLAPAGFTLAPTLGATLGAAAGSQIGSANAIGTQVTPGATDALGTGITPGAAGEGLQVPTAPGLSSMGGGTGLLAPVEGGVVSQLGFVPAGATPVLGDPKSFINDPNVLGNTVFSTDYLAAPGAATTGTGIDLKYALLAASALTGQPQQVPQQRPMGQQGGAAGVDYSGLLGLLQTRAGTANVSPLLRPATLLPQYNSLSLLG